MRLAMRNRIRNFYKSRKIDKISANEDPKKRLAEDVRVKKIGEIIKWRGASNEQIGELQDLASSGNTLAYNLVKDPIQLGPNSIVPEVPNGYYFEKGNISKYAVSFGSELSAIGDLINFNRDLAYYLGVDKLTVLSYHRLRRVADTNNICDRYGPTLLGWVPGGGPQFMLYLPHSVLPCGWSSIHPDYSMFYGIINYQPSGI